MSVSNVFNDKVDLFWQLLLSYLFIHLCERGIISFLGYLTSNPDFNYTLVEIILIIY